MLTLYSMPGACSLADHIALIWSGLPHKVNVVSHATIKSPEYLAKSPQGQVPLLENGDWILTQNLAILSYIAQSAPESGIGGGDSAESQAKLTSWLSYITSDYHKAFSNIFGATRFGLAKDAETQLKQAAIQSLCDNHLSKMNDYFGTHQYVFDNRKTVADAYFWVVTSWAFNFVPTLATDYPHLNVYFERIKQDAGVQRALEEQKTA